MARNQSAMQESTLEQLARSFEKYINIIFQI